MFPEKPKRSPEKPKRKRKRYSSTYSRLRILALLAISTIIVGLLVLGWLTVETVAVLPSVTTIPTQFLVVNTPQSSSGNVEQIIVRFDEIDPISTQSIYSGTVQLEIRGTGQAAGTDWSDAFYLYTRNNVFLEAPITHHFDLEIDGERAIDTLKLQDNPPPYNPEHQYTVYYDLGPEPRPISFRISDSVVNDNTGHFEIIVTQK